MRILAIVPARGGSKGIPNKNLVDLCGRPLIAWSIATGRALVAAGTVARCVVSTDSEAIAGVARTYGAEVPFYRPAELATDGAKAVEYVLHALDTLEPQDGPYDAVMVLQPTSPSRDVDAITAAVACFRAGSADSMISCYEEDYVNDLVMYVAQPGGFLVPKHPAHNRGTSRQQHGSVMVRNGSVYLVRVPFLRATRRLISDRPLAMKMRKIESIIVDGPEDLELIGAVWCR